MTTSRIISTLAGSLLAASAFASASASAPAREVATPVPILMYHVIGDPPSGAPYPELYVSRRDFEAQTRWLARHGYQAVTQRDVWNHWHRGRALPRRAIVITFDDGYRSVADRALPSMQARGWPGVLNLTVKNLRVRGGLSEWRVRKLIAAGWELGSHSLTHPDLTRLDDATLTREIAGSRLILRSRFGVRVDFFCYPAGRYDAAVIRAVRRAGYFGATTTIEGVARPGQPYELQRIRVSRRHGVDGLAQALAGASD